MTSAPGHVTLAVNSGSSSVKCALFTFEPEPQVLARTAIEATGSESAPQLRAWLDAQRDRASLAAVGHRIVHGGPAHGEPEQITAELLADLERLVAFAPNHLPDEIALIASIQREFQAVPQIACFDTAFHHTMPAVARRLPIPATYDERGIRRYGFHGLSYSYLIEELGRLAGSEAAAGRVILAHLGHGSSLAAIDHGKSIDTTMAFTPIGGVVMSTRSGDLDPGVVTYLGRAERLTPDEVEDLLSRRSGLTGVSGTTDDMQRLLQQEATDGASRLATDMYVYSIRKAIGALAAALHGVDTVVFSGGIGEHAAAIRTRICDGFEFLELTLDAARNLLNAPVISAAHSRVTVRVIPTNEELMIARAVHRVLVRS